MQAEFTTSKDAVGYIASLGVKITPRKLHQLAIEFDVPYRRGEHGTFIYPSEKIINAFRRSFMTNQERKTHIKMIERRK